MSSRLQKHNIQSFARKCFKKCCFVCRCSGGAMQVVSAFQDQLSIRWGLSIVNTCNWTWKKSFLMPWYLLLLGALLVMAGRVYAQSATCVSNEPQQRLNFLTSPWTAGSTSYSATVGTLPNNVQFSATAAGGNWLTGNPVSGAIIGGTTDAVTLAVNRSNTTQTNVVTFTFSKPVNNLQLTVSDLDYFGNNAGAYRDMVAITGTDIVGGTVTPTATAVNSFYVTTSGNTAYASTNAVSGNNCSTSSSNCNAIFNFSAPVVSITITYANNTQSAFGNPPNQAIGVSFGGYCLQNGQLLNLAKTWVNAVTGHTAAATTSSNRVATAALPAANATFSSTAPSTGVTGAQIRVFQGETITLPTETFGGGATAAMYTTTLQCTGGTPLSLGSAARSIVINSDSTNTVCTYTNTMGSADLKISKSTTAVVALNGTLTYKITVSNMGPATVTGATLKDPVATGITKTSVACDSSLATNKCTTAPSITALEGAGYALPALAAGEVFQILVQATVP